MKKVICFTESLGGGGAEHQMVLLAGMLVAKGYEVAVVTYADIPDHYQVPDGIERVRIAVGKSSFIKHILLFFFFIKVDVDCVISYRKMCNVRVLIPLFFRGKKIKVICSERNTTIGAPDLLRRFLVFVLYKRADFIVPNSESQTQFMKKENPSLIPKLYTIHNYTDLDHFAFCDLPSDISVLKIAVFARFSRQKNPIRFIEAIHKLREKTKRQFEVHWYGNQELISRGNRDLLDYAKSRVVELSLTDVFFFHPAVKDVFHFMGKYHAICLPSLYEGFSNSVAEAICCGKPMLVSNVADNGIMVVEDENGFLFDPRQTDSICKAFERFFRLSYADLCKMSQRSRQIAESLFDKEYFISQYVKLIES